MIPVMRATINDIPAAEDATWGAVFSTLYLTHKTRISTGRVTGRASLTPTRRSISMRREKTWPR